MTLKLQDNTFEALCRLGSWIDELPKDLVGYISDRGIPHRHFELHDLGGDQWSFPEMLTVLGIVSSMNEAGRPGTSWLLVIEVPDAISALDAMSTVKSLVASDQTIPVRADIQPPYIAALVRDGAVLREWQTDAVVTVRQPIDCMCWICHVLHAPRSEDDLGPTTLLVFEWTNRQVAPISM